MAFVLIAFVMFASGKARAPDGAILDQLDQLVEKAKLQGSEAAPSILGHGGVYDGSHVADAKSLAERLQLNVGTHSISHHRARPRVKNLLKRGSFLQKRSSSKSDSTAPGDVHVQVSVNIGGQQVAVTSAGGDQQDAQDAQPKRDGQLVALKPVWPSDRPRAFDVAFTQFMDSFGVPDMTVASGKVYYEVTVKDIAKECASAQIGWAADGFLEKERQGMFLDPGAGIGDDAGGWSYAYAPFRKGRVYRFTALRQEAFETYAKAVETAMKQGPSSQEHANQLMHDAGFRDEHRQILGTGVHPWKTKLPVPEIGTVIGVALDFDSGKAFFGSRQQGGSMAWEAAYEIPGECSKPHVGLFPALSGTCIHAEVDLDPRSDNGPDSSFKPFASVATTKPPSTDVSAHKCQWQPTSDA